MFRRIVIIGLALLGLGLTAQAQGPVVLMGIDAEDFNISMGGHGGTAPYIKLLQEGLLDEVTNGHTNILVIGAGKDPNDDVTRFWTTVLDSIGAPYVLVNGERNICLQSFRNFALICVASALPQTPSGGLTNAENNALLERAPEVAAHVNRGGGLFGTSQSGLSAPYAYLGPDFFTFNFPPDFDQVTPTPMGLALGLTNVFDTCCWHDEYIKFPGFFSVLATNDASGEACAIGGDQVILVRRLVGAPFTSTCTVGETHNFKAHVSQGTVPTPGVTVTYDITSGPNAGLTGQAVTNMNGEASFSYVGNGGAGTDRIRLYFFESLEPIVDVIFKDWVDPTACYLVLGTGAGSAPFTNGHTWTTQVSGITSSYPASQTNYPSFEVPAQLGKLRSLQPTKVAEIYAQMLLWNPTSFPTTPELSSEGMRVTLWSDGRVTSKLYGNESGIQISMETYTDPSSGKRYMRFPFSIAGP